jgi:miniconductance mechanosensitive channel
MDKIKEWLNQTDWAEFLTTFGLRALEFAGLIFAAYVAYAIVRKIILRAVRHVVVKSKTSWDNALLERKFFKRLSHFAPAVVFYAFSPIFFKGAPGTVHIVQTLSQIYMILIGLLVADAFLNAVLDIYRTFEFSSRMPIRGFLQVIKIILYIFTVIIVLSIILGKSPFVFLGGLGAMTAVLMLVFKDSILGLVAGIQLSTNNMLQIGDWIEVPKFGADGDVIDISLTTVKVQNFDKTISTIPAYALIADTFKNWRGMSESGGRRIKRSIFIDMTSVKFCTPEMTEKFRKIQVLSDYIQRKEKDLAEYNKEHNVDDSILVNGRRMTNLGTFRAYLVAYLRNHPMIHKEMTFLVRHLAPTERGLPIELYVFSSDKVWTNYEAIQADIFDHILAVIPEFELRVFQNPTGSDFQNLIKG